MRTLLDPLGSSQSSSAHWLIVGAGIMPTRGLHSFHTNSDGVRACLSRSAEWCPYEHRVLAPINNMQVPIPTDRTTVNAAFGLPLQTGVEVSAFFAVCAEVIADKTPADIVVGTVGQEIHERPLDRRMHEQRAMDFSKLDGPVTAQVPTSTNTDGRYFADTFQAMPHDPDFDRSPAGHPLAR